MEQLFKQMLPIALQCGIGAREYWELTYGEIVDTIEAYNAIEKRRTQESAALVHQLANLVGISVSRLVDKDAKYPELHEAYPTLFEVPEPQKPVQQDWRIAKERLMRYAQAHNKKVGGN